MAGKAIYSAWRQLCRRWPQLGRTLIDFLQDWLAVGRLSRCLYLDPQTERSFSIALCSDVARKRGEDSFAICCEYLARPTNDSAKCRQTRSCINDDDDDDDDVQPDQTGNQMSHTLGRPLARLPVRPRATCTRARASRKAASNNSNSRAHNCIYNGLYISAASSPV